MQLSYFDLLIGKCLSSWARFSTAQRLQVCGEKENSTYCALNLILRIQRLPEYNFLYNIRLLTSSEDSQVDLLRTVPCNPKYNG